MVYQGDADAGREGRLLHRVQVVGGGHEALGEGVEGWFVDVAQVEDELVSPEASHDVPVAGKADEGMGEVPQDIISVLVALGVVGLLEMVQVGDDEGIVDLL